MLDPRATNYDNQTARQPGQLAGGVARVDQVLVLTPEHEDFAASWPIEFRRLRSWLGAAGLCARATPISTTLSADVPALALLAWGYHLNASDWLARLARWEAAGAWLVNPIDALRWNTTKTYLQDFHYAGLPVVASIAVAEADKSTIAAACRRFSTEILVAKPLVGACGKGSVVVRCGQRTPTPGPVILQPFLPTIASSGELSLVFFGGTFSHAVRKLPAPGEFRVQARYGGTTTTASAPREAIVTARTILSAAPANLAYARVDLVQDMQGHYALMELELIEPQLFLDHGPCGAAALIAAIHGSRPAPGRS